MMIRFPTRRPAQRGFTLVELAIVLSIAGVLIAGLWRILAGGNTQTRDQAAAQQQTQLITAVKAYLAQPTSFTGATGVCAVGGVGKPCVANTPYPLPLANITTLPPGVTATTQNAYGQSYTIQVLVSSVDTVATGNPTTYSFMIMTTGGDTINDTSGGRIAALIGGDGGFVYSLATCGVATNACGAYGAWTLDPTSFGLPAGVAGHIASRTYYGGADTSNNWLSRTQIDAAASFNTMSVPLYMGGQILSLGTFAGSNNGAYQNTDITGTGGMINLAGGTLQVDNGIVQGKMGNWPFTINTDGNNGIVITSSFYQGGVGGTTVRTLQQPILEIKGPCTQSVNTSGANAPQQNTSCSDTVRIDGDLVVNGLINGTDNYSHTFVYQASDIKFKKDVQPIKNGLDDIMKINPVNFTFKKDNRKSMGVIAQEIEKIYPQIVFDESDGKHVDYTAIIAPLIESVQELKKENDILKSEINEIKNQQKIKK